MEGDCNNNTTINNESNKYEIRKNKGISDNTSINGRHSFCGGNEGRIEKVKNPLVENSKEKDESDRMKQLCKIALPHICLYVILCLYLLVGAWAFARIEHRAERLEQSKRLLQISNIYEQITSSINEECSSSFIQNPENSQKQFNSKLLREGIYSSLSRLSQFFEGPQFRLSASEEPVLDKILPPRWDPMSSTLYALSILTTTGYASATPMTPFGQWLSIGYGLLGIPLTVLAAVDIGRFLSDVVLAIYDRILRTFRRLRKLCCRIRRRRTGPVTLQNIETNLAFNTSQPSLANRRRHKQLVVNALPNKNKQKSKNNESQKNEETKRRLPLSVNAAILLLFCMLGGWVYMTADGSGHNFIEGFFVTFNLVANLTMSEMPTHISYLMTLIYIFVFVFFGLAVLSMCADLAASELKWMFLKIHYFGRKINWAKRRANKRKQQQMEARKKIFSKNFSLILDGSKRITSFN
uniref:Potassium channel domain-containing protein n=1 Tax=Meloidogyne enterolobii TaxID=390850 RepID=A0A6V7U1N2_MELEN|nr:unnamed protein product [Meloidogyne enterolobii]